MVVEGVEKVLAERGFASGFMLKVVFMYIDCSCSSEEWVEGREAENKLLSGVSASTKSVGDVVLLLNFWRGVKVGVFLPLGERLPLLSSSAKWETGTVSVSGTGGRGLFFFLLASCSELMWGS